MRLKDTREEYYFYSGKVSDIVRQLGLSGLAVVWLFKIQLPEKMAVPKELILPATLLLIGLAADLLQYTSGTIIWDRFNRTKERELEEKRKNKESVGKIFDPHEYDFTAPVSINRITKALFWTKIGLVLLAYIILIRYLVSYLV